MFCYCFFYSDTKPAFSIYGHSTPTYDTTTEILRFSSTKLNIGGNFNTSTGLFTCDNPGIYVFVLNLYRHAASGKRLRCFVKKNRTAIIIKAIAQENSGGLYSSGSGSAVVHLDPGDTVGVVGCTNTDNISLETSFIGFLLHAD